ncbi:MAG: alpha/beta hydrolase [Desulfobulbaceae bacterium]|nr:alpha/beta hydrolase [Desulfobulbaceae bacterium]
MAKIVDDTIEFDGYSVHLKRSMERRKTLLFLHGMKFNAQTWETLGTLEVVHAEGFGVYALDLPGFGESPQADVAPGQVLKQVILNQKLDKPVLVGPSMGGKVSLDFAIAHPELVGGLVLIGAVGVEDIADKLVDIKVPTLIVWGTEDGISPLANANVLNSSIADSELVFIQGAAHPCYLDQPDIWHWELISFLKENF